MLVSSAETETARLEIHQDQDCGSPREYDNLGTFITWDRNHNSPDTNDWSGEDGPSDFLRYWNPTTADKCPSCGTENGALAALYGDKMSDHVVVIAPVEDTEPGTVACSWCGEEWVPGPGTGEGGVLLPVYMLDHSGVSYSVRDYNDKWDSGQVGLIFATAAEIAENGPSDPDSEWWKAHWEGKTLAEVVAGMLACEVDEYSKWASGDCYGYTLFHRGDTCPTCNHTDGDAGWVEDEGGSCWGFLGDIDGEGGWGQCIEGDADRETIDTLIGKLAYR